MHKRQPQRVQKPLDCVQRCKDIAGGLWFKGGLRMPLEPCNARSTSHFVQPRGSYSMKQVCVCVKKWNRSDCLCAMDPEPRTDHGEALSDISPAVVHQQF